MFIFLGLGEKCEIRLGLVSLCGFYIRVFRELVRTGFFYILNPGLDIGLDWISGQNLDPYYLASFGLGLWTYVGPGCDFFPLV